MIKAAARERLDRRGARGRRDADARSAAPAPTSSSRTSRRTSRGASRGARADAAAAASLALALVAALLAQVPPTRARPARRARERDLGRRFFLEARSQIRSSPIPPSRRYVNGLGKQLVESLGAQEFDYQFFVIAHPALNAFAVPGGYVVRVLRAARARRQRRRDRRRARRTRSRTCTRTTSCASRRPGMVWSAAALLGVLLSVVNPVLGAGAIAAAQVAQLKYSREFEQEADYIGLRIATQSGYDPHSLGSFFKQLLVEQRVNPAGVPAVHAVAPGHGGARRARRDIIDAQKLRTPRGRPRREPRAGRRCRRSCAPRPEPPDVVVAEYKRKADAKPDDAEAQFLLGRVYQGVGQLDSARVALESARDLGLRPARRPAARQRLRRAQVDAERRGGAPPPPRDAAERRVRAPGAREGARRREGRRRRARGVPARDLDRAGPRRGAAARAASRYGRKGEEARGFYHLAVSARLRGDLGAGAQPLREVRRAGARRHAAEEGAGGRHRRARADRARAHDRAAGAPPRRRSRQRRRAGASGAHPGCASDDGRRA